MIIPFGCFARSLRSERLESILPFPHPSFLPNSIVRIRLSCMPVMARSLLHSPCWRPQSSTLFRPYSRSLTPRRGFTSQAAAEKQALSLSPGPQRRVVACGSTTPAGASPVVTAEDRKYGSKEVISVTPQLYDYILANVREDAILRELREETSTMRGSQMQVSPEQAQFLSMLVQVLEAKQCIELGVYTGYSSLAIALSLPETGRLVACERDAKCLEIARRYYERAGVSHKVDVRHALAVDVLRDMIQNGETSCYDFAFVDAEKRMYDQYFELLLQLVRVGGIVVFDNVLWHGKVADPRVNDLKTTSMRSFNCKVLHDKRVNISMVPVGDGMTICRKIRCC